MPQKARWTARGRSAHTRRLRNIWDLEASTTRQTLCASREGQLMKPNTILLLTFVFLTGLGLPARAQQRGATQARRAPPKDGAWWYRGTPQPTAAHPDLTGVWFGGGSGDLSKFTVAGQELILTPYGQQRYATVDHSKDPNTYCLPPGPARMIMMA